MNILLRTIKLCVALVRVEREQKADRKPALYFRLVSYPGHGTTFSTRKSLCIENDA